MVQRTVCMFLTSIFIFTFTGFMVGADDAKGTLRSKNSHETSDTVAQTIKITQDMKGWIATHFDPSVKGEYISLSAIESQEDRFFLEVLSGNGKVLRRRVMKSGDEAKEILKGINDGILLINYINKHREKTKESRAYNNNRNDNVGTSQVLSKPEGTNKTRNPVPATTIPSKTSVGNQNIEYPKSKSQKPAVTTEKKTEIPQQSIISKTRKDTKDTTENNKDKILRRVQTNKPEPKAIKIKQGVGFGIDGRLFHPEVYIKLSENTWEVEIAGELVGPEFKGRTLSRADIQEIALERFKQAATDAGVAHKDVTKAMFEGRFNPDFKDVELAHEGLKPDNSMTLDEVSPGRLKFLIDIEHVKPGELPHLVQLTGEYMGTRNELWNPLFGSIANIGTVNTMINGETVEMTGKDIAMRLAQRWRGERFETDYGLKCDPELRYETAMEELKNNNDRGEMFSKLLRDRVDFLLKNGSAVSYFSMQAYNESKHNLRKDYQDLRKRRYLSKKIVGILIEDYIQYGKRSGVIVVNIAKDSPAFKDGIKVDDIIIAVNDKDVVTTEEALAALESISKTEETVHIYLIRSGEIKDIETHFEYPSEDVTWLYSYSPCAIRIEKDKDGNLVFVSPIKYLIDQKNKSGSSPNRVGELTVDSYLWQATS